VCVCVCVRVSASIHSVLAVNLAKERGVQSKQLTSFSGGRFVSDYQSVERDST